MSQVMIFQGEWHIRYNYAAGLTATRFFTVLKEEGRLMATRCGSCGLVMLPPRSYCERCFREVAEWVDIGQEGTILASTVVTEQFEGLPDPPYALAYVVLDGADTAMLNFVRGLDLADLEAALKRLAIGNRVRVVFRPLEERQGGVTDFWYEV